jgi:hypothetical protein
MSPEHTRVPTRVVPFGIVVGTWAFLAVIVVAVHLTETATDLAAAIVVVLAIAVAVPFMFRWSRRHNLSFHPLSIVAGIAAALAFTILFRIGHSFWQQLEFAYAGVLVPMIVVEQFRRPANRR